MGKCTWYEVRVRECLKSGKYIGGRWIDGRYVKKSKFYFKKSPQDAAGQYKGKGSIMKVEKVGKEKIFGFGSFFTLGDSLLKELKKEGELCAKVGINRGKEESRRIYSRNFRRG